MSKKPYIALVALQLRDADGKRIAVEPKGDKNSGLFEAEFTSERETELIERGAIRLPEGTEKHEKPTGILPLDDDSPKGDGLDGLSATKLRAIAADEEIDLGEAKKPAEIIDAIRTARLLKAD